MRKNIIWVAGIAVAGTVVWLATTAVTLNSTRPESAGTLFGRSVTTADYAKALEAVTHEAILTYGDRYRQNAPAQEIEERAWERLLFLSEARRKRIRVSDREVVREIQNSPLFQRGGQFDSAGYQALIQYSLGTTPRAFEEETRQELMIQKMIRQVIGNPSVTEKEIRERFQQKAGSMRIELIALPDSQAAREIADACRQQPEQMDRIAKRNDLKITATGFFRSSDPVPGIDDPALIFERMSGLRPGETAGPFKSGADWLVARLKERKPPEEKDLASMRPGLEKELAGRKKLQSYMIWYQDLLKRAKPQRKPLRPVR